MNQSKIKEKYMQFRSAFLGWIGIVSILLFFLEAVKFFIEKVDAHLGVKEQEVKLPKNEVTEQTVKE